MRCRAALVLSLLSLVACGADPASEEPTPEPAPAAPRNPPVVETRETLAVSGPADATLVAGQSVTLPIKIARSTEFPVMVTLSGAAAGVATSVVTMNAGTTTGDLVLTAATNAKQGVVDATITAQSLDGKWQARTSLKLSVRGASGTPDLTFGKDGIASPFPNVPMWTERTPIFQPNGDILLLGGLPPNYVPTLIVRLHSDGSPDLSFGGGLSEIAPGSCEVMAQQSDGKIVCAGGNAQSLILSRFTTAGKLDPTFGKSGTITGPVGRRPKSLLIQNDGSFLVGGTCEVFGGGCIWRATSGGTTDASFGAGGAIGFGTDQLENLTALPANRFLVTLVTNRVGTTSALKLEARSASGLLDTSFGVSGSTFAAVPDAGWFYRQAFATYVDAQSGSISVLGTGLQAKLGNAGWDASFFRLTPAGVFDSTFGSNGLVRVSSTLLWSAIRQPDSRILYSSQAIGQQTSLTRLATNGERDQTFGVGGATILPLGIGELAVHPVDGRILVTGNGGKQRLTIARYWP